MKIRKFNRNFQPDERDLTISQRAVLAATLSDERQNAWALEMLGRRNAVARCAGKPAARSAK
jgi:hypothetical protein